MYKILKELQRLHRSVGLNAISSFRTSQNAGIIASRHFADSKERKRGKTPIGKLDQTEEIEEKVQADAYAPFPDGKNPLTGEVGGPRGPEPTRYGDWERKGRVSDF